MDASLIATTRNADHQALGTGGQLAVQAWEQITGYLRRRFGPTHAALFAEPNPDAARGVTDWYAEGQGDAVPLDSLPADQQQAARDELTRIFNDIQGDIATLRQSRREDERFLGELLALALNTPTTDSLRVLDGHPVLIAWAHAPIGAPAAPELLIGQLAGRATPAARGQPMRILGPPVVRRVLPWGAIAAASALFLLLPLLLLLFLLDPFRWFVANPPVCVIDPQTITALDELRREEARENILRSQIARVMLDMGDRRTHCPPPPAPPPRAAEAAPPMGPPASPPTQNADIDRAREQGAAGGRIQIVLAWDDANDLDLFVLCPSGLRITFDTRRACGGVLDIDQNATLPLSASPVENIVFEQEPERGTYQVQVRNYMHRSPAPPASPFRVTIRQAGVPDRTFTGHAPPGVLVTVGTFSVPATR